MCLGLQVKVTEKKNLICSFQFDCQALKPRKMSHRGPVSPNLTQDLDY